MQHVNKHLLSLVTSNMELQMDLRLKSVFSQCAPNWTVLYEGRGHVSVKYFPCWVPPHAYFIYCSLSESADTPVT